MDFLSWRFTPPSMPLLDLPRVRLLAALEDACASGLVALVAPSGFGKTVLLSQFHSDCRRSGRDAVWVTLSAEDRSVTAAIGMLETALFKDDLSSAPAGSLPRLIVRLGSRRPLVILDGADANPAIIDSLLAGLALHAPARLALIIAAREPPSSLAAAVARLRGLRLGANELALTLSESAALLAGARAEETPRLITLGAGWPLAVGLLAAYSGYGQTLETAQGALLADLQAHVDAAILSRLAPSLRKALMALAVVERFTPDLAAAVLPVPSGSPLATFERLRPWVVPEAPENGWWGLHPLMGTCLRDMALRQGGTLTRTVLLRASEWHEWRGDLDAAIAASSAAGAYRRTADLLEGADAWRLSLYEGAPQLRSWLETLPPSVLTDHPRLVVAHGYLAMRDGKLELANRLLSRAREAAKLGQDPELRSDLDAVSTLVTYLMESSLNHLKLEEQHDREDPEATNKPLLLGTIHCAEANAALALGAPRIAELRADAALDAMRVAASRAGQAYAHMHAGYAKLHLCDLKTAGWHFAEVAGIGEVLSKLEPVLAHLAELGALTVRLWQEGWSAPLQEAFGAALHMVETNYGWVEVFASALEAAGFAALAAGDEASINMLAQAIRRIGASDAMGRLAELADVFDLHAARIAGDTSRIQVLGRHLMLRSPPRNWQRAPTLWRNHVHAAYAIACWLGSSRTAEALGFVDDALRCCSSTGVTLFTVTLRLLRAELLGRLGADTQSLLTLREAALMAQAQELTGPFRNQAVDRLMSRAAAVARRDGDSELSAAIDFLSRQRSIPRVHHNGNVSGFSARESEVIAELMGGASTKSIARVLALSEHTVKFHLSAIYRKLGVETRSQVIAALSRTARDDQAPPLKTSRSTSFLPPSLVKESGPQPDDQDGDDADHVDDSATTPTPRG